MGTEKVMMAVMADGTVQPFPVVYKNGFFEEEFYAHLVEYPMDSSEIAADYLLLYLEIFSVESIQAAYDFFVKRIISVDEYRPYGCIFTVNGDSGSALQESCNNIKTLCRQNNGWIKGILSDNTNINRGVRGHISLTSGEDTGDNFSRELDLTFIPEALSLDDSNISNLISSFESSIDDSLIPPIVPDSIPGLGRDHDSANKPYKVTVYNVGSGNTITIEKDDKCILFDCGARRLPSNVYNYIISNIKPDVIIISHWHKDHYSFLNNQHFDCSNLKLIICPNSVYSVKQSFLQVALKLGFLQKQNVILLPLYPSMKNYSSNFLKKYGFENMNLFFGQNNPAPDPIKYGRIDYPRDDDDSGLILSIRAYNNPYQAILPGDCSYHSWPLNTPELDLTNTKHLVIPHHGGHIITTDVPQGPLFSDAEIYISSGYAQFKNLDGNNYPKGNTQHKDFIDNVFPNHTERITSTQSGNGISFDI